jgi:hypothetical protein
VVSSRATIGPFCTATASVARFIGG